MTTMTYRDAATDLIKLLCDVFSVEPTHVCSITLRPTEIEVQVYELNEDGHKFIKPDGWVATTTRVLPYKFE